MCKLKIKSEGQRVSSKLLPKDIRWKLPNPTSLFPRFIGKSLRGPNFESLIMTQRLPFHVFSVCPSPGEYLVGKKNQSVKNLMFGKNHLGPKDGSWGRLIGSLHREKVKWSGTNRLVRKKWILRKKSVDRQECGAICFEVQTFGEWAAGASHQHDDNFIALQPRGNELFEHDKLARVQCKLRTEPKTRATAQWKAVRDSEALVPEVILKLATETKSDRN